MISGEKMIQVQIFDEEHEEDLQVMINEFLLEHTCIDIKYSCSITSNGEDQIYCFSALIMYESE